MSNSKKQYIPKDFESEKGKGDTSANIYKSMMLHDSWKDLTPNQKLLYMTCKAEYYGKNPRDLDGFSDAVKANREYFTFNQAKWKKNGLYSLYSNKASFYRDMDELIAHGFIDCVSSGQSTRTKNLYKFSVRWRFWTKEQGGDIPPGVMSNSLRRKIEFDTREKMAVTNM